MKTIGIQVFATVAAIAVVCLLSLSAQSTKRAGNAL
jgi:hypothetical protein